MIRQEPLLGRWLARATVIVAALATFAPGIGNPLLESWDDRRFLVEFEPVHRVSIDSLVRIWSEPHFQAWHPLHLMSYWLDVPWAGADATVIHAVNAVLWALALLLVLAVLERLGLPRWAALLGTLAVGLHPVQVEAVTWATGRKEILAMMLASGAILAHLHAESATDRASWISRGLYLLAALAKTTVLPLPGLLFLIDVWLRGVPWKRALVRQVPALAAGVAFGALVIGVWQQNEMIRPGADGDASTGTASLVAATYTHYLKTALWPAATSPVYAIYRTGDIGPAAWLGPLSLVALFALAWRAEASRAKVALAGFALLLLPVSNLIPVYFQFQDRYLSFPLLALGFGFGTAAHWSFLQLRRAGWVAWATGAALVALLAGRTVQYEQVWSDDLRLWRHAAATHPEAFYARMKVGEILRDAGRLDESQRAYEQAIEVSPHLRLGHAARFNVIAMRDEAHYDLPARSLAFAERYHANMEDPQALRDLAGDLASAGYREATLVALGRSLDLDPVADERLEDAAGQRVHSGELWLARFYLSRMGRPPLVPALRPLYAEVHGATPEQIQEALRRMQGAQAPPSP